MLRHLLTTILACLLLPLTAADKSPQDLLAGYMRTKLLQVPDTITGEGLCWHAAWRIHSFADSFHRSGDAEYLRAASQYFDALIGKMHQSPDGYRGFVGPYIYDKQYICDVHVADSILINPMLELAELVLHSEHSDALKDLKPKAEAYLALAKKDLIEKWDKRGTWYEDGDHGAYVSWGKYMTADDLSEWRDLGAKKSGLSLPFNKQFDMGIACLRIYRITGEAFYQDRALKIFNFLKRRLTLYDDHYIWSYWEPLCPSDIKNSHAYMHWVNVHPYRNYQAGEMHNIVEAYHSGITFDKTDMQRFVNTNIKVMWNGDKANPKWVNSNHAMYTAGMGKKPAYKKGHGFKSLAGTLWSSLADFDETIHELAKKPGKPAGVDRKYRDLPERIYQREMQNHPYVYMAAVIPSHIKAGGEAHICSVYYKSDDLTLSLYDEEGKKIKDIHTLKHESGKPAQYIYNHNWSTDGLQPGTYRVRWTTRDSWRDYRIVIK